MLSTRPMLVLKSLTVEKSSVRRRRCTGQPFRAGRGAIVASLLHRSADTVLREENRTVSE